MLEMEAKNLLKAHVCVDSTAGIERVCESGWLYLSPSKCKTLVI